MGKQSRIETIIKGCKAVGTTIRTYSLTYALLAIAIASFYLLAHFTINDSASMPMGLYRVTHEPFQRGSIVLLREPLKEIVAVPGDTVQWSAKGVSVNGRLLEHSAVPEGSPYPPYPYTTLKLAPYQYVTMGHHPLSYDARYTGATPASLLASTVQPLWVSK